MPPPLAQPICSGLGQPHPQFDAVIERHDIQRFDIVGTLDDTFVQAESDGEVFEILRRAHHHGIGAAIVGQRQRGLFRNHTRAFAGAAVAPDLAMNGANRLVHFYSAASIVAAIRLLWRACSS